MNGTPRGAGRRSVVGVIALGLVLLAAGVGLFRHWSRAREHEDRLEAMLHRASSEVTALQAAAARLPELFRRKRDLEQQVRTLRTTVPEDLEWHAAEADLTRAAREVGLDVRRTSRHVVSGDAYRAGRIDLTVAGTRAAIEAFVAQLDQATRLYRVTEVLLPGPTGRLSVTTYAVPGRGGRPHTSTERRIANLRANAPSFDPFGRIAELDALLEVKLQELRLLDAIAEHVRPLQALEATAQVLEKLSADVRAHPAAPVETTLRAEHIWSGDIRDVALSESEAGWRASAAVLGDERLALAVGDRLQDGEVVAVGESGLFVSAEVGRDDTRLLRLTPPRTPPPITPGRETTRITGPLLPDGTPDYGAWLNDHYDLRSGGSDAIDAAVAALVEVGNTFWDDVPFGGETRNDGIHRFVSRPWTDEESPAGVGRLERNAGALADLAEAVRRPRPLRHFPEGGRIWEITEPPLRRQRLAANALAGRGMLRLGRGDLEGAAEDAETIQRLALAVAGGHGVIHHLIALAIRNLGTPLLAQVGARSSDDPVAADLLRRLRELPEIADVAEVLDGPERANLLDGVLLLRERLAARGGGSLLHMTETSPWRQGDVDYQPTSPLLYLLTAESVDWDAALSRVNRSVDLAILAEQADAGEREEALAALEAEWLQTTAQLEAALPADSRRLIQTLRSGQAAPGDLAKAIDALAATPEGRRGLATLLLATTNVRLGPLRLRSSWDQSLAHYRLGLVALALSAQRQSDAGYPSSLPDVRPKGLVPSPDAEDGYAVTYHAGAGHPPTSFALTTRSDAPGERGLCVDSTGASRIVEPGVAARFVDGACDPSLPFGP